MTNALKLLFQYRRYLYPALNLLVGAVDGLEDGKLTVTERRNLTRRFWKDAERVRR